MTSTPPTPPIKQTAFFIFLSPPSPLQQVTSMCFPAAALLSCRPWVSQLLFEFVPCFPPEKKIMIVLGHLRVKTFPWLFELDDLCFNWEWIFLSATLDCLCAFKCSVQKYCVLHTPKCLWDFKIFIRENNPLLFRAYAKSDFYLQEQDLGLWSQIGSHNL